jgi:RNA polymerase sigma-70 factor (ECF subfamily)
MTSARPSDAELLAAIAERDLRAMRELYDRHAPWLTVRLSRRCADQDVVADAVQDAFPAVWQKPGSFRGRAPWARGCGASRFVAW